MPHPLILVPGLMCDADSWQPALDELGPVADCHVVDHGQADSLVTMAQQVLDRAPPQFALAGHSMGGRVALEVMRLAPERVTHLGLFDTGYQPKPSGAAGEEEARKRFALLDIAQQQGTRTMAERWVQGMVAPHRLDDSALLGAVLDMFERKNADLFERQIRALLSRPDGRDVLTRVQVPTLVLCGQEDSWSNEAQHQEMARLIPAQPPVTAIARAGHMVMMEAPGLVAQAMRDWLVA
jgi:pimeloyl-ACP methyl ester carboxylesterase